MATTEEWRIEKSKYLCASCGSEFKDRQTYFSALSEHEADFVRLDYCANCWGEARTKPLFSFWRTRRTSTPRPKKIDKDVVIDFFLKLMGPEGEERKEMRFVLALYLTRRKALKLQGVRRDGAREFLLFRRPRRTEMFEVEDPRMSEEHVNSATGRLKELFQAEL